MISQQGDVKLYQTNNDGEIDIKNGIVTMSSGIETTVYLSLFGGNENDDGSSQSNLFWWGNLTESSLIARQYRSKTQYLLRSLPFSTANLLNLEDGIKGDLAWMLEKQLISSLEITLQVPYINELKIILDIIAQGQDFQIIFLEKLEVSS